MEVIVVPSRECPHCLRMAGAPGMDFNCPTCRIGFCNSCFVPDHSGQGAQVRCPGCKRLLFLPIPSYSYDLDRQKQNGR